jgi:hypothetical protein
VHALSGARLKNADPFGIGHKFRQGVDLHFLHHLLAMGFDRAFATA